MTPLSKNGGGQTQVIIRCRRHKIQNAIAARETTRKGKSNGGSCGGDEDYRVDEAQENVANLLKAPEQDQAKIKIADEKLELALSKKEKTRKGKSKAGKFMNSLETKIFITNYSPVT